MMNEVFELNQYLEAFEPKTYSDRLDEMAAKLLVKGVNGRNKVASLKYVYIDQINVGGIILDMKLTMLYFIIYQIIYVKDN